MNIEDTLRQALAEHAASVPPSPDRWDEVEARADAARHRAHLRNGLLSGTGLLAAAALVAFVVVPALRSTSTSRVRTPAGGATPSPTVPVSAVPAPTTLPATYRFAYQPLWPFRTQAEAAAWQQSYATGGHQPWHLDADQTALSFTDGYLGYTDIDRVVQHTIGAVEARVAVGYLTTGTRTGTAAVIHLVRFGPAADAPWEVVGTDDSPQFTLTTPQYGATASSPLAVGGRITGVDESIHVQVRQPSSTAPIGDACCLPAGGTDSLWQTSVTLAPASDPVLTISASTGGHVQAVERFTVTGVRRAGA
ncbi:MAG TPA: hypothetical protein VNY84_15130 [Acidimicrobiales bacterium]|nr:hypothetical protein [Acidimicrobiales bacterium]